ncbi:MAG: hypothetical protein AB7O45_15170 [Alphaproteobacteria bacterium]
MAILGADKAGWLRDRPAPARLAAPTAPAAAPPAATDPAAAAAARVKPPPGYVRDTADVPENLPDGPHREEVFYFCTACHGSALVARQGLSRPSWDETLTWMTVQHGMPPLEGAERERYLDYLAEALPPRRRGGFTNPFLQRQ